MADWQTLTKLVRDEEFWITRIKLKKTAIAIEGEFDLPPLGRLSYEDQVFVAEFIRTHGSIKSMEHSFGVSYPTIKNRLNRIGEQLKMVEVRRMPVQEEILDQLERGEITPQQAAERLKQ